MINLLRDFWYVAIPSRTLKPGQLLGKKLLGEPIVVGRHQNGDVFALRDICPHRGIPLHHGWVEDGGLRCCYHGWKFDTKDGQCAEIPSLVDVDALDLTRICVQAYPCQDVQGHIWVYVPQVSESGNGRMPASLPPVPIIRGFGDLQPNVTETLRFDCDIDQAVIGLMDPAHGPYVHTAWWWRSGPRKFRVKEKQYEPTPLGFRLSPYVMPDSAKPYKLLGSKVSIEIVFELPGLRTELLEGNRYQACAFTAITPIDEGHCEVHQSLYWTFPDFGLARPLGRYMIRQFLGQDRDVVIKQQEGLAYNPAVMLIDDADTQAKWYYRLKREYAQAQQERRVFQNPIKPTVLRWRS
ncbi:MAG: aromatic ring-hydroxylating dioxygenase subunit alpha [Cyanobacteria bacterium P01_D01_bin.44]